MEKLCLKSQGNIVAASSIGIIRGYFLVYQEVHIYTNKRCSYLHRFHLSKMVTVKFNLKTSVTKRKFLNVA